MSSQAAYWENNLLDMAYEALEGSPPLERIPGPDSQLLNQAYQTCDQITRTHSRTFYLASGLLPIRKSRAIRALYAFCRLTDDLVDNSDRATKPDSKAEIMADLECWRRQVIHPAEWETHPVVLAWADTCQRYGIPVKYVDQLIAGVRTDLMRQTYQNFQELATYCYGVACTVGLMSMHIIGYRGENAFPYAIRLGVALQLTNILRDIGEDWRSGRVYLPQEELDAYGLRPDNITQRSNRSRWRDFMRFQIARVRKLYQEAIPGVQLLERDGRFAIAAAAELYQAILDDIESHDYDVFNRRAMVSGPGKLLRLPGIWQRALWSRDPRLD